MLNAALRRFFAARGFVEIEAPLLVPSPGLELHLDAFAVAGGGYLTTSPEYQMKRLLAGGMRRIYSLGKAFRRGESGAHHNPEFTLLEWYRAGEPWQVIAKDVETLLGEMARELGGAARAPGDGPLASEPVDLEPPWEWLSVDAAVQRFAGFELTGDLDELRRRIGSAGHRLPSNGGWDDHFYAVFLDAVEPYLGRARPTILYDWPRPLAALAREKPGDPRYVERFEVYAGGLELANGFGELTDAVEQRRRFEGDLAERRRRGLPLYPIDEHFLAALDEMPPASGVALGVDRVAMLLLGAGRIGDVLAFSYDEL